MKLGLLLALLLCLTGCGSGLPQPRELGEIALMHTMTVDVGEQGEFVVTESSEGEPPRTYSVARSTLSAACRAVRTQGEGAVFLGHVEHLLLGEGLCETGGVIPALGYFARDEELGLGTQVWLTAGGEAAALPPSGSAGLKRTAAEVLGDLMEDGCAAVPTAEGGYAILSREGLRGLLSEPEARGLELLWGEPSEELMELGDGAAAVDRAVLTCIPVAEKGKIVGLELDVRLTAHLKEGEQDLHIYKERAAVQGERWVRAAVARAQREGLDFLRLCRRAGAARPELWKLIDGQRAEGFPDWEVWVKCTVTMTDRRR